VSLVILLIVFNAHTCVRTFDVIGTVEIVFGTKRGPAVRVRNPPACGGSSAAFRSRKILGYDTV